MKKISFKNVCKTFHPNFWEKPFVALENVNFSIGKGELVGFLGANGAGKTTSIKILLGFIKEDSGEVLFEGFDKSNRESFIKTLGYLPEKTYLYQHLTGMEFLQFMGEIFEMPKGEFQKKVKVWSERLVIDHALNRKIHTYSKGMQQRLSFISSLLNEPEFLILDEPLSGLDPMGRKDFKMIFKEINEQFGTTVFFSSHVVSDVEEICNKVLFVEKGKMIYEGSIDKLIHENSNDFNSIHYIQEGKFQTIEVEEKNKNSTLKKLLEENCNIVSVDKFRPTLESIIYKVNSKMETRP